MRLALIPPTPDLGHFHQTGIHLCLAQVAIKSEAYVEYYNERVLTFGDYVILDNGAHERRKFDFLHLLEIGQELGAREIVIPDTPHHLYATYGQFLGTIDSLYNDRTIREKYEECGKPRLMFVPQVPLHNGDAHENYLQIAGLMVKRAIASRNLQFTIGVALMYDFIPGGIYSLMDRIVQMVKDTDIQIHLLGWSRDLTTPIDVAHDYPSVRSCDTAKPFVFARHGADMRTIRFGDDLIYPGRPDDYFETPLNEQEKELAHHNVEFCVGALERGNLPDMSERRSTVSASSRQEGLGNRSGLSDSAGKPEGDAA